MQHNGGICIALCLVTVIMVLLCHCNPVPRDFSTLPDQYIRRGTIYCKRITCGIDEYVASCKTNGSSDGCLPCPEGTEMKDNQTSRLHNIQCVPKKLCPPETKPVNSTVKCPSVPGYTLPCRCDRSRGYCSLDPCNCEAKYCPKPFYLKQDCGCGQADLETSSIAATRQPSTTEGLYTTKGSNEQPIPHPSVLSTDQEDVYIFNSSTESSSTKSIQDTTESSSDDQITYIAVSVAVGVIALTALIISVISWKCRRKDVINHFHGGKHYNAKTIQTGEGSVNYQNVPERDNDNETEEDNDEV